MGITFADFAKNAKILVNTLAKAVHGEVVAEMPGKRADKVAHSRSSSADNRSKARRDTRFEMEQNRMGRESNPH